MGACFNTRAYKGFDHAEIEKFFSAAQDQDRYENGHCYSGGIGMLHGAIQWKFKTFADKKTASEWLVEHHQKWDPPIGVHFMENGEQNSLVGGWCSS